MEREVSVVKVLMLQNENDLEKRKMVLGKLYGPLEFLTTKPITSFREIKKIIFDNPDIAMIEAEALSESVLAMAIINFGKIIPGRIEVRKTKRVLYLDEGQKRREDFEGYSDPLTRVEFK